MANPSINSLIRTQISDIRRQISEHEKALRSLKKQEKDIQRAAQLLAGRGTAVVVRRRRRAGRKVKAVRRARTGARGVRKSRRTNWDAVVKSLPSTFTLDQLAGFRGVKGRSRAYLHQIINRWKKTGVIKSAGRAKYRKA